MNSAFVGVAAVVPSASDVAAVVGDDFAFAEDVADGDVAAVVQFAFGAVVAGIETFADA